MSKIIEKKTYSEYFQMIVSGEKTYDLRLADWDCETGDTLVFVEIDDKTKQPTGRKITKKVGHVGRTKDFEYWSKEEVDRYGYQVISLLNEAKK